MSQGRSVFVVDTSFLIALANHNGWAGTVIQDMAQRQAVLQTPHTVQREYEMHLKRGLIRDGVPIHLGFPPLELLLTTTNFNSSEPKPGRNRLLNAPGFDIGLLSHTDRNIAEWADALRNPLAPVFVATNDQPLVQYLNALTQRGEGMIKPLHPLSYSLGEIAEATSLRYIVTENVIRDLYAYSKKNLTHVYAVATKLDVGAEGVYRTIFDVVEKIPEYTLDRPGRTLEFIPSAFVTVSEDGGLEKFPAELYSWPQRLFYDPKIPTVFGFVESEHPMRVQEVVHLRAMVRIGKLKPEILSRKAVAMNNSTVQWARVNALQLKQYDKSTIEELQKAHNLYSPNTTLTFRTLERRPTPLVPAYAGGR